MWPPFRSVFGLLSALALSSILTYYFAVAKKRVYKRVASVSKLIIYPVKSLRGIEVDQVRMTKSGLKYGNFRDRSFIVIDGNNRMITQRQEARLALVAPRFEGETGLWLEAPHKDILKLGIRQSIDEKDIIIKIKIWGTDTEGIDVGEEAAQWFQSYLNRPQVRLLQHLPQLLMRPSGVVGRTLIEQDFDIPIQYQDGSPCLLINETSVEDFNRRLPEGISVSYRNFRPNILVADCEPYEEDHWKYIEINGIPFTNIKPCERCQIPTIDIETAEKVEEVAVALKKYRVAKEGMATNLFGVNPLFGTNLAAQGEGQLCVGQAVAAVRVKVKVGW